MPAVGLTDHGSMAGAIELYRVAGKAGIKPLARLRDLPRRRPPRAPALDAARLEPPHAAGRDDRGLPQPDQALHARLPRGLLLQAARRLRAARAATPTGIIALSGCLSGRTCQALLAGDAPRGARAELDRLVQIFGRDDVYVELQDAGIDEHRQRQPGPARAGRPRPGCPVVGTGDVHYLRAEDADAARGAALHPDQRPALQPEALPLRDAGVLPQDARRDGRAMAPWGGDALLAPTLEIAERCNVALELGRIHLPRFDEAGDDSFGMLAAALRAGHGRALRRCSTRSSATASSSSSRRSARWASPDYFLIVWDFMRFAKRQRRSPSGPGRGSAAGSLVAYALRITDLDPLRYDLLFERFLNPGPQVDARHRHRLLGARPRARDRLRDREVRARARRADHHLRQARGEGLRARRRPRDGPAVRRRRPHREARPGRRQGRLRGLPQAGPGAAQGLRRGRARRARWSTWRARSRASCARTRSTPPAS